MLGKVAIIGLGRFGRALAFSLATDKWPVLAIDNNMEHVEQVSSFVDRTVCMDSTDEAALANVGIPEMSTVVVAMGTHSVESSILTTALLKQLGVPRIIARSTTPLHGRILRIIGAHEVINPEQEAADRLAGRIVRPGILDLQSLSDDVVIGEVSIPASFVGKTILELDIRRRYGVLILAIRRQPSSGSRHKTKRQLELTIPRLNDQFTSDDILLLLGSPDDVARMSNLD